MPTTPYRDAARLLWQAWSQGEKLVSLPSACQPQSLGEGYAAQAELPAVAGQAVVGWKLAATNLTGQQHIGVDGPIAGRLLASQVFDSPATLSMRGNQMAVAEAEFALKLGRDLPPRDTPYDEAEVLEAVASLHPAIELPDSRFADFVQAGAAQLAADDACAHLFVLGPATGGDWRKTDLAAQPVDLIINGEIVTRGQGADVLGGPLTALAWLANCPALAETGLKAGQVVTTGVCGKPSPIQAGDEVVADFGVFGQARVTLTG